MGLLFWIGEVLGGAASAFAEFIGDVFDGVFRAVGGSVKNISKDMYKDVETELKDEESPLKVTADLINAEVTKPITGGFEHAVQASLDRHSPMTHIEAEKETLKLWEDVKNESAAALGVGLFTEIATLGQVEGVFQAFQFKDKVTGMTAMAGRIAAMRYEAFWLRLYQQRLNQRAPYVLPGAQDLVRMELREVFKEEFRPELLEPLPSMKFQQTMKLQGYDTYWANSYWAAHWVLPSLGDLDEMLHRGIISLKEWQTMVRRNDYLPAWINRREKIIYNPYTRVDVRRMRDLALLTKQEVLDNYKDLGYDDLHAERMAIWTEVYILAVELRARYSKGWITSEDVYNEIVAAGMPEKRARIWVQKIVPAEKETRTEKERDVTKSEIVKGVKTGILTREDGIELLIGMGYDADEAIYILEINIPIDEEDAVVKVRQLTKADILKALKTEVITREAARDLLMGIRYSPTAADTLLEIFDAQVKPPKTTRLREASKADIVLGVKKGLITQEEAYGMLLDLGFSPEGAQFVLFVKTEESPFSPINLEEFRNLVNLRRKALGLSPIKKEKKKDNHVGESDEASQPLSHK